MSDTYLLLIRHGQTEWNRDHRIQGNGDSPLTEHGHAQARAAANALQRFEIDALYASDAGRALQTAAPIADMLQRQPETDPRLRERHYGIFEGKTSVEVRSQYPDLYEAYKKRHPDFVVPGGESIAGVQARGVAACTDIAQRHPGQHVAVISHGGTIRAIARYVLDVPLMAKWRVRLENGGLTIIRYNDRFADPWWLITLNEVSHLHNPAPVSEQVR